MGNFQRFFVAVARFFETKNNTLTARRRVYCEPLEERTLLSADGMGPFPLSAVDGGGAPETAFVAAETISVAESAVPCGPYLTEEQALTLEARREARLSAEAVAAFDDLWSDFDAEDEVSPDVVAECAASGAITPLILDEIDFENDGSGITTLSGGSGDSGGSGGSGGSTIYASLSGGVTAINPGETISVILTGGAIGDKVVATISGSVEVGEDYYNVPGDLVAENQNGNWNRSISVVTKNDFDFNGDETLILNLSVVTNEGSRLSQASFQITLVDCPEFISDDDIGETPAYTEDDAYRAYVKQDYAAGSAINLRTNILALGSNVVYSLDTTEGTPGASQYFQINPSTGVITLKTSVEEYVQATGRYYCNLGIVAKDARYANDSGGVAHSDVATVEIAISRWTVIRDSNSERAYTYASDGVTVAELAAEIGLTVGEYKEWLTVGGSGNIELFDGSFKTDKTLAADDVLAATDRFRVPNTIYMAWFGDVGAVGKLWMDWSTNVNELQSLGFKVSTFDNDVYDGNNSTGAKYAFFTGLLSYANRKSLHGLYMMGHGNDGVIGSNGDKADPEEQDQTRPQWYINYRNSEDQEKNGELDIAGALKYGLGALIIHACEGDNKKARSLVADSDESIFWGWSGEYDPIIQGHDHQPIAKNWGREFDEFVVTGNSLSVYYSCTIGGKQKTNQIQTLYAASQYL